ncbi:MAG: hypothetical protein RTU92_04930 [Candidatus Thorarchaeota archaeon]
MFLPEIEIIREPQSDIGSVYTWIVQPSDLGIDLFSLYGRANLVLKVFKWELPENPLEFQWGGRREEDWEKSPITDCTIAQNILSQYELAPRVYGLVVLSSPERDYIAQVTDWVDGKKGPGLRSDTQRAADKLLEQHGISGCFRVATREDWIDHQYIDFQCCQVNHPTLREYITALVKENTPWRGTHGKIYQSVSDFGIFGVRDTDLRIKQMKWDQIDFIGKDVLDIGCSAGELMRRAYDRGATRVAGVDRAQTILAAREVSNYLQYWTLDFDTQYEGKHDIVFFLSMDRVLGYSSEIANLTRDMLIVESHPGQEQNDWHKRLSEDFRSVQMIGTTSDYHKRYVFRCRK